VASTLVVDGVRAVGDALMVDGIQEVDDSQDPNTMDHSLHRNILIRSHCCYQW